jgi:hypothetical protein
MDRRRAQLGLLTALLCGSAIAAEPLRAALWLAPETDAVTALTTRPAECLSIPDGPEAALSVEIGRAAFRAPLLLGGQAARVGLSCNSCHINGHGNPDFLFPGLSGAPGTADVTSAVMSEVRGDGAFNPKPIPDLTNSEAPMVSRNPEGGELELFVHGLVVEEFAGEAPSDAALAGLAAYVRALSPDACVSEDHESITVAAEISDARRALFAAQRVLQRGDGETGALMLAAVRSKLGEIDERFSGDELTGEREALRAAAAGLGEIRLLAGDDPHAAHAALELWPARLTELESVLVAAERRSLYEPAMLEAEFNAQR